LEDKNKLNTNGTGLGLSICKQIIERMGGKVDVKSVPGQGTSFVIQLTLLCVFDDKMDLLRKGSSNFDTSQGFPQSDGSSLLFSKESFNEERKDGNDSPLGLFQKRLSNERGNSGLLGAKSFQQEATSTI